MGTTLPSFLILNLDFAEAGDAVEEVGGPRDNLLISEVRSSPPVRLFSLC